jgi:hypothetical protein
MVDSDDARSSQQEEAHSSSQSRPLRVDPPTDISIRVSKADEDSGASNLNTSTRARSQGAEKHHHPNRSPLGLVSEDRSSNPRYANPNLLDDDTSSGRSESSGWTSDHAASADSGGRPLPQIPESGGRAAYVDSVRIREEEPNDPDGAFRDWKESQTEKAVDGSCSQPLRASTDPESISHTVKIPPVQNLDDFDDSSQTDSSSQPSQMDSDESSQTFKALDDEDSDILETLSQGAFQFRQNRAQVEELTQMLRDCQLESLSEDLAERVGDEQSLSGVKKSLENPDKNRRYDIRILSSRVYELQTRVRILRARSQWVCKNGPRVISVVDSALSSSTPVGSRSLETWCYFWKAMGELDSALPGRALKNLKLSRDAENEYVDSKVIDVWLHVAKKRCRKNQVRRGFRYGTPSAHSDQDNDIDDDYISDESNTTSCGSGFDLDSSDEEDSAMIRRFADKSRPGGNRGAGNDIEKRAATFGQLRRRPSQSSSTVAGLLSPRYSPTPFLESGSNRHHHRSSSSGI